MRLSSVVKMGLVFASLLMAAGCMAKAKVDLTVYPNPERCEKWLAGYAEADSKEMPPEGAIVCIGSSSMRLWGKSIKKDLAPLTVIPRGFGGSTMYDLLYYLDQYVIEYKPRAVVIYEGDNDVAAGVPPKTILWTYLKIVETIRNDFPEIRIYFLSVKPSDSRWDKWPQMVETNKLIKRICEDDPFMTYIDVATPLLNKHGEPNADLFLDDKLHLNPKGYEVWTEIVRPVLMYHEGQFEKKSNEIN